MTGSRQAPDDISFPALIAALPGAVLLSDGGKCLFANPAAHVLLGGADLVGRDLREFLHHPSELASAHITRWLAAAQGEDASRAEFSSGPEATPLEAVARRVTDPSRALYAIFLRDLSPERELTRRLHESERFKDQITQTHPGVVYVYDIVEQRPVFVNQQLATLLGYPAEQAEELAGRFVTLVHPEDQQRTPELLDRWAGASDDAVYETLHRLRSISGGWRWFLARDRVFRRDQDGGVREIIGISTDITRRVLDEQALRASESRFRAVYERAGMGIALCTLSGKLLDCNPALSGLIAAGGKDLRGLPLTELLSTGERTRLLAGLSTLTPEQPYRGEHTLLAAAGTPVWAQVTVTVAGDEQHPGYLIAMFEDVSDRKQRESEREQNEARQLQSKKLESLGLLAGGVAHDFNNLLLGILGNAALARKLTPTASAAARHLELIEAGAVAAGELTRQMLAFTGRGELHRTQVNLERLLTETVDLLAVRTAAGSTKRPVFVFELAQQLPVVFGDVGQLRQVCMNLVANATDAVSGSNGRIFIRAYARSGPSPQATPHGALSPEPTRAREARTTASHGAEDSSGELAPGRREQQQFVCLEVEDEGSGMSEETLSRIFDPFFTTKPGGRGLGMASVLGIVRAHGGFIHAESTPGKGSHFWVSLPQLTDTAEVVPTPEPEVAHGVALLIDDDEMVREVTRSMLELEGFEVLAAESGHTGLELFGTRPVDVVVLDLTMPDLTGEQVFTRLRAIAPQLPVVFTTGFTAHEASERLLTHPRVVLLHKPYRLQALKEHLEQVMRAAQGLEGGQPAPAV